MSWARKLLGLPTEREKEIVAARQKKQAEWDEKCRIALEKFNRIEKEIDREQVNIKETLPINIRSRMVELFANDNYHIQLGVGGPRGISADVYFCWRSGTTRTLFNEKDYDTATFIRMMIAAYKFANLLNEKRNDALKAFIEGVLDGRDLS
jgi:hypothetical protein